MGKCSGRNPQAAKRKSKTTAQLLHTNIPRAARTCMYLPNTRAHTPTRVATYLHFHFYRIFSIPIIYCICAAVATFVQRARTMQTGLLIAARLSSLLATLPSLHLPPICLGAAFFLSAIFQRRQFGLTWHLNIGAQHLSKHASEDIGDHQRRGQSARMQCQFQLNTIAKCCCNVVVFFSLCSHKRTCLLYSNVLAFRLTFVLIYYCCCAIVFVVGVAVQQLLLPPLICLCSACSWTNAFLHYFCFRCFMRLVFAFVFVIPAFN